MNTPLDPHSGCTDFARASRLSRRGFLQGMAAGTGAVVATQMFGDAMMEASFGATGAGNVLVVLSFRGGIDGLGMVVPHGDPGYYQARPQLAVPRASVLAADPMFGFHPAMAPLLPLWRENRLAAVHAVGMKVPNRSHFQAMELIEDADPTSSVRRGWVNRMIGLDGLNLPHEAIALGSTTEPTMMSGPAPTLATSGFDKLRLAGADRPGDRRYAATEKVWGGTTSALGVAARSAMTVSKGLGTSLAGAYTPADGADYPEEWPAHDLSEALKDSARLVKADLGTSVISIDFGSWDMHADYGTLEWGEMQSMTAAFASSVAAFFRDLGPWGDRVTLATISEFGRRVTQNGNRGLDHGWGNMMLVMGGGVRGGQYYGSWPGLGAADLLAGDLAVTTDYRDVLGEVIGKRFPDRSLAKVFPGLTHAPVGLML